MPHAGRHRRTTACAVAAGMVLIACQTDDVSQVADNTVPATTEAIVTPIAVAPHALAYRHLDHVWLATPDREPLDLGLGDGPVFTADGRFVAWRVSRAKIGIAELANGRRSEVVLDVAQPVAAVVSAGSMLIVALDSGLVTDTSPERYAILDPAALIERGSEPLATPDQLATPVLQPGRAEWQIASTTAGLVVTGGDDSDEFIGDPELWSVTGDGIETLLFADCGQGECSNTYGMFHVAISPDGAWAAYEGGDRQGCRIFPSLRLRSAAGGPTVALTGLPADGDFLVRSIAWTSPTTLIVAGRPIGPGNDDTRCLFEDSGAATVYDCDVSGACAARSTPADFVVANSHGDVAVAEPLGAAIHKAERKVTVTWSDGRTLTIDAAYAPVFAP